MLRTFLPCDLDPSTLSLHGHGTYTLSFLPKIVTTGQRHVFGVLKTRMSDGCHLPGSQKLILMGDKSYKKNWTGRGIGEGIGGYFPLPEPV